MIRKQSALEEAEEPEPVPKERTMAVWKLAEWLGLTEAGIRVFENNGTSSEQQQLDTELRMLAYCEEILKVKRSLSRNS
jgi:hypothetical protein